MHRHVLPHGDDFPGALKQRARIIAPLLNVGGKRSAPQRRAHLLGDGVEQVLEDFQFDGIAPHEAQCTGSGSAEPVAGELCWSLANLGFTESDCFLAESWIAERTLLLRIVCGQRPTTDEPTDCLQTEFLPFLA